MSDPSVAGVGRARRAALACVAALLAAGIAAAPADAGSRVLRWTHVDSSPAAGFRIHLGSRSGFYDRIVVLGRTAANDDGVYSAIVDLGDEGLVYVAVSAYDRLGRPSALSNERSYVPDGEAEVSKPGAPAVR